MGAVPYLGRTYFVEKFGVVEYDIIDIMKLLIIVLLMCVILLYLFFPPVNKERLCYETSQSSLNLINEYVISRDIQLSDQCDRTAGALYALEACIKDATKSSVVASSANDMIQQIVASVRMSDDNLWTLKADHNEKCIDFNDTQLP